MFKKMFKDIAENLIDKAQKAAGGQQGAEGDQQQAAGGQQGAGGYSDVLKDYMQADMQKAMDVGAASAGMSTMNTATEAADDPLLAPVHGITIADYAAGAAKIAAGCTDADIAGALQVEAPLWDEAKTTWNNRMRSDKTFNVVNVYTKYFGKAKEHEKLGALVASNPPQTSVPTDETKAILEELETDKFYFFEIQGALQAAYDNGLDGAQWLVDHLGLTVGQVNGAGTKWMSDYNVMAAMIDHQEKKRKEYSEKFAQDNGTGGVADDIEF